jgi:hypothetical protein
MQFQLEYKFRTSACQERLFEQTEFYTLNKGENERDEKKTPIIWIESNLLDFILKFKSSIKSNL